MNKWPDVWQVLVKSISTYLTLTDEKNWELIGWNGEISRHQVIWPQYSIKRVIVKMILDSILSQSVPIQNLHTFCRHYIPMQLLSPCCKLVKLLSFLPLQVQLTQIQLCTYQAQFENTCVSWGQTRINAVKKSWSTQEINVRSHSKLENKC